MSALYKRQATSDTPDASGSGTSEAVASPSSASEAATSTAVEEPTSSEVVGECRCGLFSKFWVGWVLGFLVWFGSSV